MKILKSLSLLSLLFFSITPTAPIDTQEQSNQVSLDKNTITPEQLKLAVAFFEKEEKSQKRKANICTIKAILWFLIPAHFYTLAIVNSAEVKVKKQSASARCFDAIFSISLALYILSKLVITLKNKGGASHGALLIEKALFETKTCAAYKGKNLNPVAINLKIVEYLKQKLMVHKKTPTRSLYLSCISAATALGLLGAMLTCDFNEQRKNIIALTPFLIIVAYLSIKHARERETSVENIERMSQELEAIRALIKKNKIGLGVLLNLADGFGKHSLESHLTDIASE